MSRRLVLNLTAAALFAALAGCGQSPKSREDQQQHAAGTEQPGPAAGAERSEADRQKILAALPAPYNTADLANGKAKFALCAACHTITAGGPNLTGPNLHGVVGRQAGSLAGYNFSAPLKAAGFAWDAQHLEPWITQPRTYIPGTKMTFAGLKAPKDRADLIAYVMVESGYGP